MIEKLLSYSFIKRGWEDFDLDDCTFQLLIATFEIDDLISSELGKSVLFKSTFDPERIFKIHNSNRYSTEVSYEYKMQSNSQDRNQEPFLPLL